MKLTAIALTFVGGFFCGTNLEVTERIEGKYGDVNVSVGLSDAGEAWRHFEGDKGWALAVSGADGNACIVAEGTHWETSPAQVVGEPV